MSMIKYQNLKKRKKSLSTKKNHVLLILFGQFCSGEEKNNVRY